MKKLPELMPCPKCGSRKFTLAFVVLRDEQFIEVECDECHDKRKYDATER
jgi:predicted nucleic-acid-binding Zn-ribbon protein